MNALNSGKTNFQSVSDATLAEMFALPAHAKSACLTTTIPALLKRRLKQVLRRAISTLSVHSMLPADVPLHLLNRKFIKDANELYGEYQAGEDADSRYPLVNFDFDDCEPSVVYERGGQK